MTSGVEAAIVDGHDSRERTIGSAWYSGRTRSWKQAKFMPEIIDWQQPSRRHRRVFFLFLPSFRRSFQHSDGVIVLRRRPLVRVAGCGDIFRKTLSLQWAVFAAFFALTFLFSLRSHDPHHRRAAVEVTSCPHPALPRTLGVAPHSGITGATVMTKGPTLALYWRICGKQKGHSSAAREVVAASKRNKLVLKPSNWIYPPPYMQTCI